MTVEQERRQSLARARQFHLSGALEKLLEKDLCFEAGKMCADAEVDAVAEAEVQTLVALRPERFRVREFAFVAVARGEINHDLIALSYRRTSDLGVFRRCAAHLHDRRNVAHHFV